MAVTRSSAARCFAGKERDDACAYVGGRFPGVFGDACAGVQEHDGCAGDGELEHDRAAAFGERAEDSRWGRSAMAVVLENSPRISNARLLKTEDTAGLVSCQSRHRPITIVSTVRVMRYDRPQPRRPLAAKKSTPSTPIPVDSGINQSPVRDSKITGSLLARTLGISVWRGTASTAPEAVHPERL